jgi:hypothetical protein
VQTVQRSAIASTYLAPCPFSLDFKEQTHYRYASYCIQLDSIKQQARRTCHPALQQGALAKTVLEAGPGAFTGRDPAVLFDTLLRRRGEGDKRTHAFLTMPGSIPSRSSEMKPKKRLASSLFLLRKKKSSSSVGLSDSLSPRMRRQSRRNAGGSSSAARAMDLTSLLSARIGTSSRGGVDSGKNAGPMQRNQELSQRRRGGHSKEQKPSSPRLLDDNDDQDSALQQQSIPTTFELEHDAGEFRVSSSFR